MTLKFDMEEVYMKKILQGIAIFMIAIFGACDIILLCLNEVSSAILSIIVTIVFVIIFIKVKETSYNFV